MRRYNLATNHVNTKKVYTRGDRDGEKG